MSAGDIRLQPEAESEVAEAALWYEAHLPGLGIEFLASLESTLDSIRHNPYLYPEVDHGARRALTQGFPFAVFFHLEAESITILAVRHQAQDPLRWLGRFR